MDQGIGFGTTHNFVRLETVGTDERLHCDYAIIGLDQTRKTILLRRALSVIAAEEKRLYALTDNQAIAELDALKATQDVQSVRSVPPPQA